MRKPLIWLWIACSPLHAGDDPFEELFADPATRSSALPQLVPGNRDAYFYHALAHQLAGREDAYRQTISDWKAAVARGKDPVSNEGLDVLENRRLITELSKNPSALTGELTEKLHLDLHHARPDAAAAAESLPTRLDPARISEAAFESLAAH